MTAINLSKQALDSDSIAMQQINFTGNLSGNNNRLMLLIIEKVKETILHFSQRNVKVLSHDLATACSTILFCSNIISI